jgi:hypothetical protein
MPATDATRTRKTLLFSILDGIGYSIMVGAGETYFVPYALFLGSSNLVLGLFVALPILVGSLSQIFSERLLALCGSRKRLICSAVALQILTFVPMVWVRHLPASLRPEVFLAVVCVYWACGLVLGPSWSSLMGDLVPRHPRAATRSATAASRSAFLA